MSTVTDDLLFRERVIDYLITNQMIQAVKEIKSHYQIGLKEAKDVADDMRAQAGLTPGGPGTRQPRTSTVRAVVDRVLDKTFAPIEPSVSAEEKLDRLADVIADKVWEKLGDRIMAAGVALQMQGTTTVNHVSVAQR